MRWILVFYVVGVDFFNTLCFWTLASVRVYFCVHTEVCEHVQRLSVCVCVWVWHASVSKCAPADVSVPNVKILHIRTCGYICLLPCAAVCVRSCACMCVFCALVCWKVFVKKNPAELFQRPRDESEVRDRSLFPTAVAVEEDNSRPPLSLWPFFTRSE